MKKLLGYISLLIFYPVLSQNSQDTLQIMFVGDIMNHGPQIKAAYDKETNTYNYDENFQYLFPLFSTSDVVIGNLETTLGVKPYSGYPQFSAPKELAIACKNVGITIMATANNHTCDKRKKGIISTLNILDTLHIKHLGTYRNKQEQDSLTPLIFEVRGYKIALLNYTYGTNGLPVPYPTKVNTINKTQIKKDIEKAKLQNPDAIIVFLHWGIQYKSKASAQQIALKNFLNNNGVQIVIGSHPHVLQPVLYSTKNNKQYVTVYSLGNFISNQRTYPRDGSMAVEIRLTKDRNGNIKVLPPKTTPLWVYKYVEEKKRHYQILPVYDFELNPEYFKTNAHYQKMMRFLKYYKKIVKY